MESMEPTGVVEGNNLFVIDTTGDITGQTTVAEDIPAISHAYFVEIWTFYKS